MRTFFCLEIPEETRKRMAKLSEDIYQPAYVKWVDPANLHVTLKFLGEVEPSRVDEIEEAAKAPADHNPAFTMEIDKLGSFPKVSYPKVIWLGSSSEPAEIHSLYADLEEEMAGLGFDPEERDYIPHITLGRTKEKNNGRIKEMGRELESFSVGENWEVEIDELTLMESELRRDGPVYTPLFKLPLQGEDR
ncbi:RNA 2',3'-cyclic phosphodiesterase [Candidatus Bipolaricaulota bacterium]|nr:RNA 2',3'-cyclic phosphodiesterase [Candidatus Bipolaricaulota bacterium]